MSELYQYSMIIMLSVIFTLACVNCWLGIYKTDEKEKQK